jgi:hypothetical protein
MNDMEITPEWIDRYNENELNEDERAFFRKKMDNNPLLRTEVFIDACLNNFYEDKDTLDLMKKIEYVSQKHDRGNSAFPYLMIAASLLCIIAMGAVVYLIQIAPADVAITSHRRSTQFPQAPSPLDLADSSGKQYLFKQQKSLISSGGEVQSPESTVCRLFPGGALKVPAPFSHITPVIPHELSYEKYLASAYTPMADFESLVGSVTRSALLKLIAPAPELKIPAGSPVVFEWISQIRKLPISILVFNNRGNLVFETPTLITDSYVLSTIDWPGGIYYWKIIIDEEMILIGRFMLL